MDFLMSKNADLASCVLVATGQIPNSSFKKNFTSYNTKFGLFENS